MLLAFLDGPLAFLAAFLELPRAGPQVPQPFFTLGQLDLDLGSLAAGGCAAALQPVDLLTKPGQGRLYLAQAMVELFSLLLGFVQAVHGRVVLGVGRLPLPVQRRPLLVQLAAAFLGGGDGHPALGHRGGGLLIFGRSPVDLLLLRGDLLAKRGQRRLGGFDGRLQLAELRLQSPQLTPPRDQAGRHAAGSDHQRSVAFQQFAGQGHEA